MRSKLTEMVREHGKRPYLARPVPFGGPVEGPDEEFVFEITNKDYFEYRRDQMGWGLQMRARRTERLMNGESVNPRDCLFIDKSRIPLWETLINQLAQPEWQETSSGHIKIEKQPKVTIGSTARSSSPDAYDATILSAAADSDGVGLSAIR